MNLQATQEELKEQKRCCWNPACKKTAWFQDWSGWHWCPRHAFDHWYYGDNRWFEIKKLKLRWPY